jgi:hypothetical protein
MATPQNEINTLQSNGLGSPSGKIIKETRIQTNKELTPPPPPNGGLVAWLQVAGAFFLFFNSW